MTTGMIKMTKILLILLIGGHLTGQVPPQIKFQEYVRNHPSMNFGEVSDSILVRLSNHRAVTDSTFLLLCKRTQSVDSLYTFSKKALEYEYLSEYIRLLLLSYIGLNIEEKKDTLTFTKQLPTVAWERNKPGKYLYNTFLFSGLDRKIQFFESGIQTIIIYKSYYDILKGNYVEAESNLNRIFECDLGSLYIFNGQRQRIKKKSFEYFFKIFGNSRIGLEKLNSEYEDIVSKDYPYRWYWEGNGLAKPDNFVYREPLPKAEPYPFVPKQTRIQNRIQKLKTRL
jgi:hypothetical protein